MYIYRIFDKCIPHPDDGSCYHYCLFENIFSDPRVIKCRHNCDNNPEMVNEKMWINVSDDLLDYILSKKPSRLTEPIFKNRPHISSKILDLDQISDEIMELIGADCWGLYIRYAKILEMKELLYVYSDESTHSIRNIMYTSKEMVQYLLGLLNHNEELVIVMNDTLHDDYVRKLTDNLYILIKVEK